MRQSQAIAIAAVVVAVSLLLAFVSWIPDRSTSATLVHSSMSDDAKAQQSVNHHHQKMQPVGLVGGKGAEQPISDETKQVRHTAPSDDSLCPA